MTGGVAVVLGETGRNFGAGMTNGVAFVYDPADRFERRYNPELVTLDRTIELEDLQLLRQLISLHREKTGSTRAREILAHWAESLLWFWKVRPRSQVSVTPASAIAVSSAEPAKV